MFSEYSRNKKVAIIAAILLGVTIVTSSIIVTYIYNSPGQPRADQQSLDSPAPPDMTAVSVDDGVVDIIKYGFTKEQVDALKHALLQFSRAQDTPLDEITVNSESITHPPRDPEQDFETVTFTMTLKETATYSAKVEYFDLTAVHLYVSDSQGQRVYDSGVVDVRNNIGVEP